MTKINYKIRLHWCILDKHCQKYGAPKRLYLHVGAHTFWFNPFEIGDDYVFHHYKRS